MTSVESGLSSVPRYCWRRDWVVPYESLWSLLHKFAALNWVYMRDVKQLFRKTSTVDRWQRYGLGKWNLHTLWDFDAEKIRTALKLSPEDLNQSLTISLISSLEIRWLTPEMALRFCPECINRGYHSVFHQLYALSECPIHGITLTEKCHRCGGKIPYKLNDQGKSPYSCPVCQRRLWVPFRRAGEDIEANIIELDEILKPRLDNLFAWFATVLKTAVSLTNMERWSEMAAPEIDHLENNKDFMQVIGEEILGHWGDLIGCNPPDPVKFRHNRGSVHNSARCWSKHPDKAPYHDIDHDLFMIYKAVRRHIVKIFLGVVHRKCAAVVSKSIYWEPDHLDTLPLCPWAFAYLFWRKHWEMKVHGYKRKTCFVWDYGRINYKLLSTEYERDWLRFRICAQECYWTFQECVLLAEEMNLQGRYNWDDTQISGILLPYWAVEVSDSQRPVFHWWPYKALPSKTLKASETNRRHQQTTVRQADAMMPGSLLRIRNRRGKLLQLFVRTVTHAGG